MSERIPQSVAKRVPLKAYLDTDHVSAATGKTIAVVISKNGGSFANPSGGATNATEIANGWYYVDLSTTDTGTTGPLVVRGTNADVDDVEVVYEVANAFNAGFTGVPGAAADGAGGLPISDAGGLDLDARLDAAITSRLAPTTAGRTLDVTAGGCAGIDWANVEAPTTAVNLSATNIDVDQAVASVSGAVGSVTGNVGGNVAGSVASVTAGVTLAASAVQAIWDALTSALTTVGSIGKLLVDNVNATISSRLASASYTAPLDAAGTRSAVGLASANLDTQLDALPTAAEIATAVSAPSAATIADAVWDEDATAHQTQGTFGQAIGDPGSDSDTIWALANTNLNATVGSRASQTSVDTIDDLLDTEVASIISAIAALSIPTGNQNADALLDRADGIETGYTLRQALRLILASQTGKLSGAATSTITIRDIGDTKARITAAVDADGNRSAVTTDAT